MKTSTYGMQIKMGIIFLLVAIVVGFCSCTGNPPLFINTVSVVGEKETESTAQVESEYFEATLSSITQKDGSKTYIAKKELLTAVPGEVFKYKYFYIPDEGKNKAKVFTTPAEFLSFMSEYGYEMVDQAKAKYHIDYTFKKNH